MTTAEVSDAAIMPAVSSDVYLCRIVMDPYPDRLSSGRRVTEPYYPRGRLTSFQGDDGKSHVAEAPDLCGPHRR